MQQEHSEVKCTCESNLAEGNALVAGSGGIDGNYLEVERKRLIVEENLIVLDRNNYKLEFNL